MTFIPNLDYYIQLAKQEILEIYGDEIAGDTTSVYKFGKNQNIGTTAETVQNLGGIETYVTTNLIDRLSSSEGGDGQLIVLEGYTISSGVLTFVTQPATLMGQTAVVITTPLARVTRLYNDSGTDFVGDVYAWQNSSGSTGGVPDDLTKAHIKVNSENQSLKCSLATSSNEYLVITSLFLGINKKQVANVDFSLLVREKDEVFRAKDTIPIVSTQGSIPVPFKPYLIVPPNSDIRVDAVSSAAGTSVDAAINGVKLNIT